MRLDMLCSISCPFININVLQFKRTDSLTLLCCVVFQLKVGFVNCILDILVLMVAINTWGNAIFGFGTFPDWAQAKTGLLGVNGTWTGMLNATATHYDLFTTASTFL
jgi:hypothetical protein